MLPFALSPIAAMFITGAGIGMNAIANQKAAAARDRALGNEMARQRRFDQEAAALNTQAQDRYKDFGDQQEGVASDLTEYFQQAPQSAAEATGAANVSAGSVMPTATNDVVTREIANQKAKAGAFTGQQADARGRLRSFGDLLGDISRQTARDAGTIGQVSSFKSGSSGVLPYELEAANQKGGGYRMIGDILKGVGSIATTAGIANAAMGAAPGTSAWNLLLGGGGPSVYSAPSISPSGGLY